MTRRMICALGAFLSLGATVSAADLPVKALRLPAAPLSDSGFYWLLESHIDGTKVGVTSPTGTPASIFAAGGNVGLGGGYVWTFSPNRQIAVEGWADYQNTGANAGIATISTRLTGTQRVLYIGDSAMFTQWLPNLSLTSLFPASPQLPTSAVVCPVGPSCNPLSRPYIGLVVREARNEVMAGLSSNRAIRVTWGATAGFKTPMTDGSTVDTYASVTSSSGPHLTNITPGVPIVAREGVTFTAGVTWNHALTNKLLGL